MHVEKTGETMYSSFDLYVSDGAGHTPKDDRNSSMEAADSTLEGRLFHSLAVLQGRV